MPDRLYFMIARCPSTHIFREPGIHEEDLGPEEDPDYSPEDDGLAVQADVGKDEEGAVQIADKVANVEGESVMAQDWRDKTAEKLEVEVDVYESSDDDVDCDEASEDEDEEAMKAEVVELESDSTRDLQGDLDNLVEMVEYMTLPPAAGANGAPVEDVASAAQDQEEDMEEAEQDENQGQNIL